MLFEFFLGNWQITRQVIQQETTVFVGQAIFEPNSKHSLIYTEQGANVATKARFSQKLLYEFSENDWRILRLPQLTILHKFKHHHASMPLIFTHTHQCSADIYNVCFMLAEQQFSTQYRVTGPKKDYGIQTLFNRGGN